MDHYNAGPFTFLGAYASNASLLFLDSRGLAGGLLFGVVTRLLAGMSLTFVLMLLRVALRRQWLAAAAMILLWSSLGIGEHSWIAAVGSALFSALFAATLLRFGGLLPTIVCFFVGNELTDLLTTDLSTWYAGTTISLIVVTLTLTAYAFHIAVAGRPLFNAGFLEAD